MIKCVHCLQELAKKTKDHVFPSSWYPDSTPTSVQRWTVPSCLCCNGTYGALEKELFIRLAICVDPTKAEASGISKKALRSLGIGVKDATSGESAHRESLRKRIMAETHPLAQAGDLTLLPGVGPHSGFKLEEQRVIEIPYELMHCVCGKVLRGCEYKMGNKRYIEEPYRLEIHFAHDGEVKGVTATCESIPAFTLGPGFEVRRAQTPPNEPYATFYRVMIWGTIKIYATVGRDEDLAAPLT
jgi:hypothetical protein